MLDGSSVEKIRERFKDAPSNEISQDQLAYLIRLNSKAKKAAEKFNMNIVEVNNTQEVVEESNEVVAEKPAKKKRSRKKKTEETPTEEAVMAEEAAVTEEVITE